MARLERRQRSPQDLGEGRGAPGKEAVLTPPRVPRPPPHGSPADPNLEKKPAADPTREAGSERSPALVSRAEAR